MVKHLRTTAKVMKLLALGLVLFVVWGAIWLQSAVHTLNFTRPWILSSVNPKNSPYEITIGDVTIDWQHMTELGTLRISNITLAKREGAVFAQLPQVYATVDPLGFLPHRKMLRTVMLHDARLFVTRNVDKMFFVGIEGADSPIGLAELMATFASGKKTTTPAKLALPFQNLVIDRATLRFHDDATNEDMVGENVNLVVARKGEFYNAIFAMAFTYDGGVGTLKARLAPDPGANDYLLNLALDQFPSRFVCVFAHCPENTEVRGKIVASGTLGLMADGAITGVTANVTAAKATLTAPAWFVKPITLINSEIVLTHDVGAQTVAVSRIKLGLEDTELSASVQASHKEDGWYVDVQGKLDKPLDVIQLYKYWPLFMAPQSREWVTSKLKAGSAATASVKMNLTPTDISADVVADKSISADVAARDITVDYLPKFPYIHHLDGDVHITGNTVKVDGKNGTALSGLTLRKAILWCPDLNHPNTPMEVTLDAALPVTDAITLLTLDHFVFDDALTLNSAKASGNGTVAIALKFDAFSDKPSSDPNAVHFDAVDYDIKANIANFAQTGVAGGYDVRALNGDLTADVKGLKFVGSLALGDSAVSDVNLAQATGGPLILNVKSQTSQATKPGNDFNLTYKAAAQSVITLKGKRLDATASYDTSEHNLLKDFPALKLDIALDQLFLSPGAPLTNVSASLNCTMQRCESLRVRAMAGKGQVTGDILRESGARQLVVTASDAGAFLKALDVTDRMTRGTLELRGTYDDSKSPAPYDSRLLIQDFTLKNSQILGRILSIGSLTGLRNVLTGSGIAFEKMAATINANRGVITVSEGRANGAAMGITVGGTVDTTTTAMKLKGVVVPAYALNSILGNIPIVGALAGGEGEGLIAFNYSVNGTYDKPDVSVNPLSGLTPGFLRGIFGVFDRKVKAESEKTLEPEEKKHSEPSSESATEPTN